MTYALYLGCIAPLRYPEIEASVRRTFDALGIPLVDMPGANCCPAGATFRMFDDLTALALSARNLDLAEDLNADLMVVCNGCYGSLHPAAQRLNSNDELREKVNEILAEAGRRYEGKTSVVHMVEVLYDRFGPDGIRQRVKKSLAGLKVATHVGCHILRPSEHHHFDDPEDPRKLDELCVALGAESVDYMEKEMCCGAGGGVMANNRELSMGIIRTKLRSIKESGADCIVVICPFCHLQYDAGQKYWRSKGEDFEIPIYYYTQLLGVALGLEPSRLGAPEDLKVVLDRAKAAA